MRIAASTLDADTSATKFHDGKREIERKKEHIRNLRKRQAFSQFLKAALLLTVSSSVTHFTTEGAHRRDGLD